LRLIGAGAAVLAIFSVLGVIVRQNVLAASAGLASAVPLLLRSRYVPLSATTVSARTEVTETILTPSTLSPGRFGPPIHQPG